MVAILVEYSAIAYFIFIAKQPLSWSRTISEAGALDSTRLVFSLSVMTAAVLFGSFGFWLSRKLPIHRNFLIIFCIGVIAQTLLSWLPAVGSTAVLHLFFAIIVMVAMPVVIYYYSLVNKKRAIRKYVLLLFYIQVLALFSLPFASIWKLSLLPEAVTSISFHLWAILATFENN